MSDYTVTSKASPEAKTISHKFSGFNLVDLKSHLDLKFQKSTRLSVFNKDGMKLQSKKNGHWS